VLLSVHLLCPPADRVGAEAVSTHSHTPVQVLEQHHLRVAPEVSLFLGHGRCSLRLERAAVLDDVLHDGLESVLVLVVPFTKLHGTGNVEAFKSVH